MLARCRVLVNRCQRPPPPPLLPRDSRTPQSPGCFLRSARKPSSPLTGIVLVLFVIGHMLGNMTVFFGPDVINAYAMHLRDLGPLLWLIRLAMLTVVVAHIWFTMLVWKENLAAHPQKYAVFAPMKTTIFARTMRLTGLVVLAFVAFHLAHFTLFLVNPAYAGFHTDLHGQQVHDVYRMVIVGFRNPFVSLFYIVLPGVGGIPPQPWHRKPVSNLGNYGHEAPSHLRDRRASIGLGPVRRVCLDSRIDPFLRSWKRNCTMTLDAHIPPGPLEKKWTTYKNNAKIINPANKRKFKLIIVGSGLAGASAAATLGEQGFNIECFCYQDSARRAHSIAAQGGINAAKNYQNDGDSVYRLFYDTIKGGDFRAREANVYRLAEVSALIIDQCVAQGVPFAREYGGLLANRSFGGAQVSRTFYARGQTGQQLLLGTYQAMSAQIATGQVKMFPRAEMLDLVVVDGHAKGIVVRDMVTGEIRSHAGDAVLLCTGGYGNVFYLSTNAKGCNVTATYRAHKRGALFGNPCYTQIHPTCIPVSGDYQSKLTLMSESLRNDGRVWAPKRKEDCGKAPHEIPEEARDYYLERKYPSYGNLAPRDISSRSAKEACDEGRGVGPGGLGVYLDFADAIKRLGRAVIEERYGNLFEMYENITGENAYERPMRIYPAVHYTMGGLWVDYNLMSNVPGLHVLGEANFSDHGANRLGASALMQGLADGYFVIPYTIGSYLATQSPQKRPQTSDPAFQQTEKEARERVQRLLNIKGTRSVDSFHRELGLLMWDKCGMARDKEGLEEAIASIPEAARGILDQRQGAWRRRKHQPIAREGWTRRGFFRIWRTHVPGRTGPQRIVRRPFPHRIPNAGWRSIARRRKLRPRLRVEIRRRRQGADPH